jgi:beta-lactamase superfamily II metal-dependent hydrolase
MPTSLGARIAVLAAALLCLAAGRQTAGRTDPALTVVFIDVEGGQATLFVSPSGESMLVDAGYPGFNDRDADRIAAEARRAGVQHIDYMVVTHYHRDHVGGVPAVAARLPIRTFVDHGASVEQGEQPDALFNAYAAVRQKGRHLRVRAGDRIPVPGLDVRVVSSGGELITKPILAGGGANPLCKDFVRKDDDPTENARSVGIVVNFGAFRLIDLGDLTWNKEHGLVCPNNLIGPVDVYLTTHHGLSSSGPAALVHAVRPLVAIMNNGATKGGTPEAWRVVKTSPGLEDFWQLHYAVDAGPEHNVDGPFIANQDETSAYAIRVTAFQDGRFIVTNDRNGRSKNYVRR